MMGRTHLSAGILTGEIMICAMNQFDQTSTILLIGTTAIGSLLPDIDHPQSMVSKSGKITKNLSSSVSAVTQHRGFTHTPVFTALVMFILFMVLRVYTNYAEMAAFGLGAGMVSHLILDTLNENGIMWLCPIVPKRLHVAKIRTGTRSESVFRGAVNIAATVGLVYVLYHQFSPVWRTIYEHVF